MILKLNKIAIYQEGGQFLEHRDTAYAVNHKGTLLVELPSYQVNTLVAIWCYELSMQK